jgi:hypothetical protein
MIRKYLFIALAMLPLLVCSQDKRTIIVPVAPRIAIQGNNYHHHNPVSKLVRYITSPFRFVERMFCKERNFTGRIYDRVTYRLPLIEGRERIIMNRQIIRLPHQRFLLEEKGNRIIIEKNGRRIYINRARRI